MFYKTKFCLETWNIFNIFKYILKIIFMSTALFLIILYIFILKNNNNPYKTSENNWKILSKNIIFSSCQTSFSIFFLFWIIKNYYWKKIYVL